MATLPVCKITVLKRMSNPEFIEQYRRSDAAEPICPLFTEGQEFLVQPIAQKPADFGCEWAWDDLHKILVAFTLGGNFGPWMKDGNTFITCCTDGSRPVIFKVEKITA